MGKAEKLLCLQESDVPYSLMPQYETESHSKDGIFLPKHGFRTILSLFGYLTASVTVLPASCSCLVYSQASHTVLSACVQASLPYSSSVLASGIFI